MSNPDYKISDLQFKHPCNILVSGPSGSGKTVLIRNILKNFKDLLANFDEQKLTVLWIYGVTQDLYKIPLSENVNITYVNELPDISEVNSLNPNVLIIDDLMEVLASSKKLTAFFTKYGHHNKRTIIFTLQNLLYQASQMRTISLNSHYIIVMKNPRDESQLMHLARQIDSKNPQRIIEAYRDAVKTSFGYLCIDFKPNTDPNFQLKTSLTREENKKGIFAPVVYFPKSIYDLE